MKKQMFLLIAGTAFTLAACNDSSKETTRLQATNDSLRAQIAARDNDMDSVLTIFNEIQEGFTQISQAQNRITLSRTGDPGNRQAVRAQIQEDMKFIINTMKSNQERIAQLQAQVKKQGMNTTAMEKTLASMQEELVLRNQQIETLQAELQQRNIQLEGLDNEINELNANIEALDIENTHKDRIVSEQDKNLHTAYFAIGTQRELKEKRILEDGEVLKGNYEKDYFTTVDIRSCNTISLMSKKAKLLTNHPTASYKLTKGEDKNLILKINDPKAFWSISKYLVIRVW